MSENVSSGALKLLGLARKAGSLQCGENAVVAVETEGKARLIVLAEDASEHIERRVDANAGPKAIIIKLPFPKEELGAAIGSAQTAVAAVTDLGLANAFAKKLAEEHPGKYEQILQPLNKRTEKAARRKRETAERGGRKKTAAKRSIGGGKPVNKEENV